jgi:hypothetical protein
VSDSSGQPLPSQYYDVPVPKRRTNRLAIASLVLGIVWVYWIGSVLAIVFGFVARDQIGRSGQRGGGMAIAGIVLGCVGLGFFVLIFLWTVVSMSRSGL